MFCHLDYSESSVCSSVLVCANIEYYLWCRFIVSMKSSEWASQADSQLLSACGNIRQQAGKW